MTISAGFTILLRCASAQGPVGRRGGGVLLSIFLTLEQVTCRGTRKSYISVSDSIYNK